MSAAEAVTFRQERGGSVADGSGSPSSVAPVEREG